MAPYTAALSTHQTTSATAFDDTVTLDSDFSYVEVMNRDGAGLIYFCVDDQGGPAGDGVPTVGGKDTYVVPASLGAALRVPSRVHGSCKVRLKTSVAVAYSVTGVTD